MWGQVLGAGLSIGGAILGGNAQEKASKEAAEAQLKVANKNNALAQWMYGQNQQRLDPYAAGGLSAQNALQSALLGTPYTVGQPGGAGMAAGYTTAQKQAAALEYLKAQMGPKRLKKLGSGGLDRALSLAHQDERSLYNTYIGQQDSPLYRIPGVTPPAPQTNPGGPAGTPPATAQTAFDAFRNSTNYKWQLAQGNEALQTMYAGRGLGDSGAVARAAMEYNQNMAQGALGSWMDRLAQQQQVGMGAASALAGVGQNLVNNVTSNNQNAANAASNAALQQGAIKAGMWGQIGGALGGLAGSMGSGFGGGMGG